MTKEEFHKLHRDYIVLREQTLDLLEKTWVGYDKTLSYIDEKIKQALGNTLFLKRIRIGVIEAINASGHEFLVGDWEDYEKRKDLIVRHYKAIGANIEIGSDSSEFYIVL